MNISLETKEAFSEVDEFLELLTDELRNKIPKDLRNLFKENKDNSYIKKINPNVSIKEQNLKDETLAIIALLNLQYLCQDEEEKERLKKVYENNENKYRDLLQIDFNDNNIFKKKYEESEDIQKENKSSISIKEYKEPIFKKIINKIKKLFHK